MHLSFLPYLRDPATHAELTLEADRVEGDFVLEGTLKSVSNRYPIVRGIPRFAGYRQGDNYAASFGYQWRKWSRVQFESENRGRPMEGHTLRMWERITGINDSDLAGAMLLDCGCGPGRFLDVVVSKNGRAIGIDLSDAVESAGENFRGNPRVLICQGDVLNLPIRDRSVDAAFSIGVFHHTPAPQIGFEQMCRAVRGEGRVAVCVYGKGGYYDFPTVTFYRKLFRRMRPLFGHYPPLVYSYVAAYGLRRLARIPGIGKAIRLPFPFVTLPDAKWSLLDTFDSVTPTHQSAHESYEVYRWLKDAGLTEIEPSDWGFSTYHGKIPAGAEEFASSVRPAA